jgi:sugar lactone lactonase YvrE
MNSSLKNNRLFGIMKLLMVYAVLVSFAISCNNDSLMQSLLAMEQTTLVLELEPPVGFRTIYPDFDLEVETYDISGTGPGGASFSVAGYSSSLFTRIGLEAGEWTIKATAKNADGVVIGNAADLTIMLAKAKTTQARLVCKALGGDGSYTLRISWPAGLISVPKPEAELVSRTGERHGVSFINSYSEVNAAGLRQVPTGYYSLKLRISDLSFGSEPIWQRDDEIYIAEGLTTVCGYPLAAADLTLKPGTRTFAGSDSFGSVDGLGTAATFYNLGDVAMAANGTLYIADTAGNRIRKITPEGVVSTFAGGGGALARQAGFIDGLGTAAAFNEPSAIIVESNGNLLVADSGNHAIRRISTGGMVQTLVGNGTSGDAEGTINTSGLNGTARLNYPCGIASAGTYLYIADSNNNKIRRVYEAGGSVITYAGSGSAAWADGTGTSASFNYPMGIIIVKGGIIYVADVMNNRIRKIFTFNAGVSTLAGGSSSGSADGLGSAASFKSPRGIALSESGNLYVGDTGNNKIRQVTSEGQVSTIAGSGTLGSQDGPGLDSSFSNLQGLAAGGPGKLFVADTWNNRVRLVLTR